MFTVGPAFYGAAKDSLYSSVIFLLSPQYMPAGTTINDQSAYAATGTRVGSTQSVSATQPLFGGNTIDFGTQGSSRYLEFALGNYWTLAHYQTIEGWFYFKSRAATATRYIGSVVGSTDSMNGWQRPDSSGVPGAVQFFFSNESSVTVALNQWVHLCAMRGPDSFNGGSNCRLYIAGTVNNTVSSTRVNPTGMTNIRIGGQSGSQSIDAYCGGFRFTTSASSAGMRYAWAGFTPPTEPFPIG